MKLRQLLQEARKNPELNPKTPINDIFDSTPDGSFVSFTAIDKLGINPKSVFTETPLGIYAYRIEYVRELVGDDGDTTNLPYAGGSPYANIFQARGNIVDLNAMDNSDVMEYFRKMRQWIATLGSDRVVSQLTKAMTEASQRGQGLEGASPGEMFWYTTQHLAASMAKVFKSGNQISMPTYWNKIFRAIGIDGAVDKEGIIFPDEPEQAVFFSIKAIQNNKRYHDKYSPTNIDRSTTGGTERRGGVELARQLIQQFGSPEKALQHFFNEGGAKNRLDPFSSTMLVLANKLTGASRTRFITEYPGFALGLSRLTPQEFELVLKHMTPDHRVWASGSLPAIAEVLQLCVYQTAAARYAHYAVNWVLNHLGDENGEQLAKLLVDATWFGTAFHKHLSPSVYKKLLDRSPQIFGQIRDPHGSVVQYAYQLFKSRGLDLKPFQRYARELGIRIPKKPTDDDIF